MVQLRITWRYCVAFYCVGMLYISLHELAHHVAGYLICGDWGTKSFNYFATACEGTRKSWYATYAGPLLTFAMMYVGLFFIARAKTGRLRHLGFALIFSQWPLQRMLMPFFHMNDEYVATAHLLGPSAAVYWLVIVTVSLICLPPLVVAYRAIANRRRLLWFVFYFVAFPYLLIGPIFGSLEYLMVHRGVLAQPIIGIGLLFIINEIVTVALYLRTRKWIDPHAVP